MTARADHRPAKRVAETVTVLSELMMPNAANFAGFVHGGYVLGLVDRAAFVCASRFAEALTITAAIDRVDFLQPIRVGELVTLTAQVNYAGRSSMEIGIVVTSEDLRTRQIRHTNYCLVTMVAVDSRLRPVPAPRLLCETPEERRRYRAGEARRAAAKQALNTKRTQPVPLVPGTEGTGTDSR